MRLLKHVRDFLIISVISLVLLEVVLRCVGMKPYQQAAYSVESVPGPFISPDPNYGFQLAPGSFAATINDSLSFSVAHSTEGFRNPIDSLSKKAPSMLMLGCSFTYGWGVNDNQTVTALLQEAFGSELQIRNQAVPGYGTVHGFMQLQKLIKQGNSPDILVMNYATFHDERNVLNANWREGLHSGFLNMEKGIGKEFAEMETARFPFVESSEPLTIAHRNQSDLFRPIPFRNILASANAFQNISRSPNEEDWKYSLAILEEMQLLCNEEGIRFVVCNIVESKDAPRILSELSERKIEVLNLAMPIFEDDAYNNLPFDSHPSAFAHQHWADSLTQFLRTKVLTEWDE